MKSAKKNTKKKANKKSTQHKSKTFQKEFVIDGYIIGLYTYLKKVKLNPKHNFINFTTRRTDTKIKFTFHTKVNHKYNSNPKWGEIKCKEESLGKLSIKTYCFIKNNNKWTSTNDTDPGLYKVFVKGCNNFYDYIMKIKTNKISLKDHNLLFDKLLNHQEILTENGIHSNFFNHNLDVKTLHFKFTSP